MQRTLEGFPEVTSIQFVPEQDLFIVDYRSADARAADFQRSVEGTVVAPTVREALGRMGEAPNSTDTAH